MGKTICIMKLSTQAVEDLRTTLRKLYGVDFESALSDEEVNEIGDLLLNVLAESLKMKVAGPELSTTRL